MARPSTGRRNEIKIYVDDETYDALLLTMESSSYSSLSEAAAVELKARLLGSIWMVRKLVERSRRLPSVTVPAFADPQEKGMS